MERKLSLTLQQKQVLVPYLKRATVSSRFQNVQSYQRLSSNRSINDQTSKTSEPSMMEEELLLSQEFEKKLKMGRSSSTLESQRLLIQDCIRQFNEDMNEQGHEKIIEQDKKVEEEGEDDKKFFGEQILNEKSFRSILQSLIMEH